MTKINRDTIKELLSNTIFFLLLHSAVGMFYVLETGYISPLFWTLGVPFFLMYIVRTKIRNNALIIVIHIALAAGVSFLFWFDPVLLRFVSVVMAFCVLYSYVTWRNKEWDWRLQYGVVLFVPYLLMYLATGHSQFIFVFLVSLLFIILYRHMDNFDFRLALIKQTDMFDHPSESVIRSNNMLIIVFVVVIAVFGVIAVFFPLGTVLSGFFTLLYYVTLPFRYAFTSVYSKLIVTLVGLDLIPPPIDHEEEVGEMGADPIEQLLQDEDPSRVVLYIVLSLLAVGVFALAAYLIGKKVDITRKNESDGESDVVNLERTIMSDLLDLLPKRRPYRHPLRRVYAKKVNGYIKSNLEIGDSDATDIIAKKILPHEDISELTAAYEEIRYGREQIKNKRV